MLSYGMHMVASKLIQGSTRLCKFWEQNIALVFWASKHNSTTAQQALLLINLACCKVFWNCCYLYLAADIDIKDMIDIDEAAFYLKSTNSFISKVPIGVQLYKQGLYGHKEKRALVMTTAYRAGPNDCFVLFEKQPGTNMVTFYNFLEGMICQLGPGTPGICCCFPMNNLLLHQHLVVLHLIVQSSHWFAFWIPCYPVNGPIKYFLILSSSSCHLQCTKF